MINKPSVEDLMRQMDSRYTLVVTVSKRARALVDGARPLIRHAVGKPVTIAINEVNQGKVWYTRNRRKAVSQADAALQPAVAAAPPEVPDTWDDDGDEAGRKDNAARIGGIPRGLPGVIDIDLDEQSAEAKKDARKRLTAAYKLAQEKKAALGRIKKKSLADEEADVLHDGDDIHGDDALDAEDKLFLDDVLEAEESAVADEEDVLDLEIESDEEIEPDEDSDTDSDADIDTDIAEDEEDATE